MLQVRRLLAGRRQRFAVRRVRRVALRREGGDQRLLAADPEDRNDRGGLSLEHRFDRIVGEVIGDRRDIAQIDRPAIASRTDDNVGKLGAAPSFADGPHAKQLAVVLDLAGRQVEDWAVGDSPWKRAVEDDLAEELGLESGEVIIDFPVKPAMFQLDLLIERRDGRVQRLGLEGVIPTELGLLTRLSYIDFTGASGLFGFVLKEDDRTKLFERSSFDFRSFSILLGPRLE